jgi:hypothetical protein
MKKASKPSKAETRKQSRHPWQEAVIVDLVKLMAWPGVQRISLGWKERKGKMSSRFCVKIYVTKKKRRPRKVETLPKSTNVLIPIGKGLYKIRRLPTDIVWHAEPTLCSGVTDFLNPTVGGAMLSRPAGEIGSYACMVAASNGSTFALTAGHVLQPVQGTIAQNRPVVQPPNNPPSLPPGETILLGRTKAGFFGNTPNGFLDFCLIELRTGRTGVSTALDGLPISGVVLPPPAVTNGKVHITKFGATTGRTNAEFSAPVQSIVINGINVTKVYEFKGLPGKLFGDKGDSGALVVSIEPGSVGAVVGVLFATAPPTPDAPTGRGFVFPFDRIPNVKPV